MALQRSQRRRRSKKPYPPPDHGERTGFLGCSNPTAWVRAINCNAVYITSYRSMRIPVFIRTRYYEADNQKALVDSGATDCFIHPRLAARMKVGMQAFDKPKKIFNIDNTENKSGSITHFIDLKVQTKGMVKDMRFLIADIGTENLLLGYPWLAAFEPGFKWQPAIMDSINFPVIISSSFPSPSKVVIAALTHEDKLEAVNQ